MARYYESKTLIEFVKKYTPHINGETTMECVERAIREAPTADVVPKSEVERLQAQNETLDILVKDLRFRNKELQTANEGLSNNVQDLEIEIEEVIEFRRNQVDKIFEAIEDLFKRYRVSTYGSCYYSAGIKEEFNDLKKKYTEQQSKYFSPQDVRRMTAQDVRDNYTAIMESMKTWGKGETKGGFQ